MVDSLQLLIVNDQLAFNATRGVSKLRCVSLANSSVRRKPVYQTSTGSANFAEGIQYDIV